MISIQDTHQSPKFALWALGFRPFFLIGSAFAIVSMLIWLSGLHWGIPSQLLGLPVMTWHGHEMVFGYSSAIIAGFLLTAARNWTGVQTMNGNPLKGLVICWLAARIAFFLPVSLIWVALLDMVFMIYMTVGVVLPVYQVKQWRQTMILLIVFLFMMSNATFYWGVITQDYMLYQAGLYMGFYLVTGMILVMGRRVVPFFIEKGVGYHVQLKQSHVLDMTCLFAYIILMIGTVAGLSPVVQVAAGICAICFGTILKNWYTPGIWRKPLLWVLYIGLMFLFLGCVLLALTATDFVPVHVAIHSFAVGGIGVMTMGMMARISLGHTGRSIHSPPKYVNSMFILLFGAAALRVLGPIILPAFSNYWMMGSQILWILAFLGFTLMYAKMWLMARVDGLPG